MIIHLSIEDPEEGVGQTGFTQPIRLKFIKQVTLHNNKADFKKAVYIWTGRDSRHPFGRCYGWRKVRLNQLRNAVYQVVSAFDKDLFM